MDLEPAAVALKFAFLGVLYLFLFWLARSARRDLRAGMGVATSGRGLGSSPVAEMTAGPAADAWLVVERCADIEPGTRFDPFGGITLGRSAEADVTFSDRYASGIHAKVYSRGSHYYVEDLDSTNGTVVDGHRLTGRRELGDGTLIEIGDTRFRIEFE